MQGNVYKPPHMPWYERDFWSFRVRLLEPLARLMYRSLLQQGWHSDRPPYLPSDDDQLMKLADAPSRQDWECHRNAVLGMFEKSDDGQWYVHPKALALLDKVSAEHEARKRGGQTGGRNRSAPAEYRVSNSSANAEQELSPSNQNQNQNQSQNQNHTQPEPKANLNRGPIRVGARPLSALSHFVSLYNDKCGKTLPSIRGLTRERVNKLNARLNIRSDFQADFSAAVKKAANTPFLTGHNERGWKCSFDWLIENDTNCIAVLEGKYDGTRGRNGKGGAFHDDGDRSKYIRGADFVCDNSEN